MGFYSFWSVTGNIVTKAVAFGSKVLRPILNGITNIANTVRDTAGVLSMVPVIGAVSSQISAAANIIASVSSAGVEIIDVGERYVSKHNVPEPVVQMEPIETPLIVPERTPDVSTPTAPAVTMPSNIPQLMPTFFNVLPRSPTTPAMAPLIAPIVPKNDVLSHPERRILRMGFLNIDSGVPKTLKTGGIFDSVGGMKRSLDSSSSSSSMPWMRV